MHRDGVCLIQLRSCVCTSNRFVRRNPFECIDLSAISVSSNDGLLSVEHNVRLKNCQHRGLQQQLKCTPPHAHSSKMHIVLSRLWLSIRIQIGNADRVSATCLCTQQHLRHVWSGEVHDMIQLLWGESLDQTISAHRDSSAKMHRCPHPKLSTEIE